MSGGLACLQPTEADIQKMIMANVHVGAKNCQKPMSKYVFKRRADGVHIIDVHKTYEKILFAARIIAAIENPADVCAISGRPYGQRAVLKFCAHTGGFPIAGRFTPGAFTNQIQKAYREPRLLVLTDPLVDHQAAREASYVNLPVIALCDVDVPSRYIDVVIPCNNKAPHAVGLIWWMISREVLRLRGTIPRDSEWDVMPDLYFYRDPEEVEKEEAAAILDQGEDGAAQWDGATTAAPDMVIDPAVDPAAAAAATAALGVTAIGGGAVAGGDWNAATSFGTGGDDWSASAGGDWSAAGGDWGTAQ